MPNLFKVAGLSKVIGALKQHGDFASKLKPIVTEHTEALADGARNRIDSHSGELASSIETEIEVKDDWVFGRVTARAEHAINVEYGTSHREAEPFLRPAHDRQKKLFEKAVRQAAS